MKSWKESKMIWVALGLTVLGGVQASLGVFDISTETQGYIVSGIGVLMGGLRAVTKTAITA